MFESLVQESFTDNIQLFVIVTKQVQSLTVFANCNNRLGVQRVNKNTSTMPSPSHPKQITYISKVLELLYGCINGCRINMVMSPSYFLLIAMRVVDVWCVCVCVRQVQYVGVHMYIRSCTCYTMLKEGLWLR